MATHNQRVFKFDLRSQRITEVGKGAIGVIIVTTKPYPFDDSNDVNASTDGITGVNFRRLLWVVEPATEIVQVPSPTISAARLRLEGTAYTGWPQERATPAPPVINEARLVKVLRPYSVETETASVPSPTIPAARLVIVLRFYTSWPQETASTLGPTISAARFGT